jgi:hypothetical protein
VHTDSLFVVDSNSDFVKKQKGIFDDSSLAPNTFDKPFGLDLGSNRGTTNIRKTPKKQKQKPHIRTDVFFLGGGRFLKNKKKFITN